jgi:phosphoribosylformylglycinamidine synthase
MAAPESLPTSENAQKLGLLPEELEKILGRQPNNTELTILSVVQSKYTTNGNAISWLRTLPRNSDRMVDKAGGGDGNLVNIGDGLACSFTVESRSGLSAIPSETGTERTSRNRNQASVRPIAQFDAFHLGDQKLDSTRQALQDSINIGVGQNSAHGVPTVGKAFYFNDCYNANSLASVFSVGIVEAGKAGKATAYGVGDLLFVVGSTRVKNQDDTLIVVRADDSSLENRMNDATVDIKNHVVDTYEIGDTGIIGSIADMNADGPYGMSINLDYIPTHQSGLNPSEILLSELPGHSLVVVENVKAEAVRNFCSQRDLTCVRIGEVTASADNGAGRLQVYHQGEQVADVPTYDVTQGKDDPQNQQQEYQEPAYIADYAEFDIEDVDDLKLDEVKEVARLLIEHPNVYSRRWMHEQTGSTTSTNNNSNGPSDAAVIRVKDTLTDGAELPGIETSLIITVAGNSRYVNANPRQGAMMAVVEAARNIVCSGGDPLAVTVNMDFGDPHASDVNWQFVEAVQGVSEACRRFSLPVMGSNANFNKHTTDDGSIFPTPTIGMLGLMENPTYRMSLNVKNEGDRIYLIGPTTDDIAASEYLYSYRGIKAAPAPVFDVQTEWRVQEGIRTMIRNGWIQSAHGVSEGGLFTALVESAMAGGKGFAIESNERYRLDAFLFGEGQSRVVVTVSPEHFHHVEAYLDEGYNVFTRLGSVTAADFVVDETVIMTSAEARELYNSAPGKIMNE